MRNRPRLIPALILVLAWATGAAMAQDAASGGDTATPVIEPADTSTATVPAPTDGAVPVQQAVDETAPAGPDYAEWNKVAARAEQAVEAGRASDLAMQNLRAELVKWRETFATARRENAVRISTLKTQIATLGPAPAEGGIEPAILTDSRNTLTAQLAELEAPVKTAELAYSRADALISAIDNLLRTRQTDQLFLLGPTPVNPANWPGALSELTDTIKRTWSGMAAVWSTETRQVAFRQDLPLTLLLAVIALVLLSRGRVWVMRLGRNVTARAKGPAAGVWSFVLSLGQVLAPLLGIYALVEALHVSGLLGLRAQIIIDGLPQLGLSWFVARWLGNRVFGPLDGVNWSVFNLGPAGNAEGRLGAALLGLLYGLWTMLIAMEDYEAYSAATRAMLEFPILVVAGLLLFRLGRLLVRAARPALSDSEDTTHRFLGSLQRLAGRATMLIGLAGPAAAAIGYSALAQSLIFPTALTLALIAAILIVHWFWVDLYGLLTRRDEATASEALVPVLVSFALAIAMLPLLALIWGARVTDITELWTRIGEGFVVGGSVVRPADFLTFAVVFALGFGLTRLIQGTLKTTILPKTRMDLGGRNAITSGVGYVGIFLAAILAITSAGFDLSSLAIVAGALSVGIGFGLQNVVSNFVSGIILLIERPISEGDWIEVGGQMGYVRDISVRSTRIETFDRTDVILPNSDLISGVVTNFTRGNLIGRVIVPVGVAYGTDTKRVETILREVAEAHPIVAVTPSPNVYFMGFGADSLDFEIRAILKDVNYVLHVKSDMNHEIARRFAEEEIEIPFAQRDIWLRNPEVLPGAVKPKRKARPKATAEPAAAPTVEEPEAARASLDEQDLPTSHGYGPEDADD